jgi:glycosyltransferase involved in cell wall biosynthesis
VRIVIATSRRKVIGGVEKYIQSIIPSLLERGHSIGLLYEHSFDPGDETIDPTAARLPYWCIAKTGQAGCLRELATWKPDLVYSHGLDDTTLETALLERHATILYAHTYWGTCISGRKCHAQPRLQPCARRLGPACLALYYPRRCGGLNPNTMLRMYREQSKRNLNLRSYQAVLVASRHMYREFEQHGVDQNRLQLVPLPSTGLAGARPPATKVPKGRICFLGRLMDVKGVGYLLQAMRPAAKGLGRRLTVTIAGDGPDRASLQELATRLGVDAEFTGWVSTEQRLNLLAQADLLAVPSLWPEPFGLVGIEAGCVGVPAVGYAVGGIPDWLIPGVSGELAPGDPPTVAGLADALVRALTDHGHYSKLAQGAWEMAREYSLAHHMAVLEPILTARHSAGCPTAVTSRVN